MTAIEEAISLGEIEYIDELIRILIDFAATMDDDIVTDTFYQRLSESLFWWENIKAEYEEESQEEEKPEEPKE